MNTNKEKVRTALAQIDYDFSLFTLTGFANWLEQQRGRPLHFLAWSMPASTSGAWVKGDTEDHIFYPDDAAIMHQAHVQFHEISHIILGHPPVEANQEFLLQHEISDVDFVQILNSLLLRSSHSEKEEREEEAEFLASLIQTQIIRHNRLPELMKAIPTDETIATFMERLGI